MLGVIRRAVMFDMVMRKILGWKWTVVEFVVRIFVIIPLILAVVYSSHHVSSILTGIFGVILGILWWAIDTRIVGYFEDRRAESSPIERTVIGYDFKQGKFEIDIYYSSFKRTYHFDTPEEAHAFITYRGGDIPLQAIETIGQAQKWMNMSGGPDRTSESVFGGTAYGNTQQANANDEERIAY